MDKAQKQKELAGRKPVGIAATDAVPATRTQPAKTIRIDDCSMSIWGRDVMVQGQHRVFFSVTFERSYKDRNGMWRYTKSFDADSLGKVATLCHSASEAIRVLEHQATAE